MVRRVAASVVVISALALAAFAGVSLAAGVSGSFPIGNARFEIGATYLPDQVPARRFVPIGVKAWFKTKIDDGSMPPRLDVITVDLEENVRFARRGLGACDPESIRFASTKGARKRCKDAFVGRGSVNAVVQLEDQERFVARGPLLIFNGVDGDGRPAAILHTLAEVPLPTTFVMVAKMEPSPFAGYGTRITVRTPEIAQGQGVLSAFDIRLKKRPGGKRYVLGRCPSGRVKVKTDFDFAPEPPVFPEGRDFHASMAGTCLAKRR